MRSDTEAGKLNDLQELHNTQLKEIIDELDWRQRTAESRRLPLRIKFGPISTAC
jgi:hypothetical protein